MYVPPKIPGLKGSLFILGLYMAVWISLEGKLGQVIVMAVGVTAVATGYIWQKWVGGKTVRGWRWVGLTAVTGLLLGLASGPMVLLFMGLKTGLHAHGPEFTAAQITWVIRQMPLWSAAGLAAGLGLGLLSKPE